MALSCFVNNTFAVGQRVLRQLLLRERIVDMVSDEMGPAHPEYRDLDVEV